MKSGKQNPKDLQVKKGKRNPRDLQMKKGKRISGSKINMPAVKKTAYNLRARGQRVSYAELSDYEIEMQMSFDDEREKDNKLVDSTNLQRSKAKATAKRSKAKATAKRSKAKATAKRSKAKATAKSSKAKAIAESSKAKPTAESTKAKPTAESTKANSTAESSTAGALKTIKTEEEYDAYVEAEVRKSIIPCENSSSCPPAAINNNSGEGNVAEENGVQQDVQIDQEPPREILIPDLNLVPKVEIEY